MPVNSGMRWDVRGNYIAGAFRHPVESNGEIISRSPADLGDELGRFRYSYASVDEAVGAARGAAAKWRRAPVSERADALRRYQSALKKREAELSEAIAREVGKPLWESRGEWSNMLNKVDITLADSMKLVAPNELPKIMDNTLGACRYRPHGVMAVIGPFNFPGHLANGHIVPALATGNTVVFKPSEKAPLVGQIMAECFHEAELPEGVFNLVQGEREVGRRLVVHEGVDGVLFTGSYEVGTRIKQDTLQQHWKLLALEMGGKNSVLVWKDAHMETALHESLFAAYVTAGQRCSATSRILVHEDRLQEFVDRFHQRAKGFLIGHPMENPFMGPLIDQSSVDRYLKFQGIAAREGSELIMRGKALELRKPGYYVTPSIALSKDSSVVTARKSVFQQTELFAPSVIILPVKDLDQAIELANETQYGLVSSVFTADRQVYERCLDGLETGLVNWNKSTVGASSKLPFGGFKKSGNHFPTAVSATLYCTSPVASLEVAEPKEIVQGATPGLNWE
jgi:succinylglutamic semialdehyde dehydrogenase